MLPASVCLVDDDHDFTAALGGRLQQQGMLVSTYADSDELLTAAGAYDHGFYLLDLMVPGIDGLDVLRLLRRRTQVGILVLSARTEPDAFDTALGAGADMFLCKPVRHEQVIVAIKAVQRRVEASLNRTRVLPEALWRLDRGARALYTPGGQAISLSKTDLSLLDCFVSARGAAVSHATLCQALGRTAAAAPDNWLHATVYRLRRRLEKATPEAVPLQVVPRVGYVFKAKLTAG